MPFYTGKSITPCVLIPRQSESRFFVSNLHCPSIINSTRLEWKGEETLESRRFSLGSLSFFTHFSFANGRKIVRDLFWQNNSCVLCLCFNIPMMYNLRHFKKALLSSITTLQFEAQWCFSYYLWETSHAHEKGNILTPTPWGSLVKRKWIWRWVL